MTDRARIGIGYPEAYHPSLGESGSESGSSLGVDERQAAQLRATHKLNQVIQQFYFKSSLTIISSRTTLPQAFNKNGDLKQNKWFNLILDDTDEFQDDIRPWKTCNVAESRPPPLVIEVYLDLAELTQNQTLVILDDQGKRWDVASSLNPPVRSVATKSERTTTVTLERWQIELGPISAGYSPEGGDPLPNTYKKSVVLFRSLWMMARSNAVWKLHRRIAKQGPNHPNLKLHYRILDAGRSARRSSTVDVPLYPSEYAVAEKYTFAPTFSPAGDLCISVVHRRNCEFRVDDSEALLSSQFMGMDDQNFRPTVSPRAEPIPGSMPTKPNYTPEVGDPTTAYGSLSTFHQGGAVLGTSPLSTLRAVKDFGSTPPESQKDTPKGRFAVSRTSVRGEGQRRPSVSFPAFKAGSLASSPASNAPIHAASPGSSLGRGAGTFTHHRGRGSITTLPQQVLRTPGLSNDTAIASSASASSSPKPAPISRYSSSFGHRRSRFSSGGGSKIDEDNTSSGKASISSSAQPGSGVLNEGEASTSSVQADDDNIKDFIRLLEQKKDLQSFQKNDAATRQASTQRTTAVLSRFQKMKESNAALSESMASSLLILHRSSSSSSRQLSNVPQIAGTSISTASSPGKPISPHTPHTPSVPSRLSVDDGISYPSTVVRRSQSRGRTSHVPSGPSSPAPSGPQPRPSPSLHDASSTAQTSTGARTDAIDIPTSPRAWPFARRSSSANPNQPPRRERPVLDDDVDAYGLRSASVPADDGSGGAATDAGPTGAELGLRELSLSELHQLQESEAVCEGGAVGGDGASPDDEGDDEEVEAPDGAMRAAAAPRSRSDVGLRARGEGAEAQEGSAMEGFPGRLSPSFRTSSGTRLARDFGGYRGGSSTGFSTGSKGDGGGRGDAGLGGSSSGSRRESSSTRGGGRYAFPNRISVGDEEELLFSMSELGAGSRRSLEAGGSSGAGLGELRKGGQGRGSGWR